MPSSALAAWLKRLYPSADVQAFVVRSYKAVFGGEHGAAVLLDLQKACYMTDTTTIREEGKPLDPYQMAVHEGRRQAYLHIAGMLDVTSADIRPKGKNDYDHRDERREPDDGDERRNYQPRWPAGHDPDLDGPIPGADPAADGGTTE